MLYQKRKSKKGLILCLAAVFCFMAISTQMAAYEVSAAGGCSSPNSDPDAKGFYDTVRAFSSWIGNFYLKYSAAKEPYYKRAASGGSENSWIDTSDIHYHISHGAWHWDTFYQKWLIAVMFEGTLANPLTPNATYLDASEARNSWGDRDLEWIAFRNCELLNNTSWRYWSKAMNRLHLILGFKTSSYVADNFGRTWAWKMKRFWWWRWTPWPFYYYYYFSRTITQAWFGTCDSTQPPGVVARVIAENYINFWDHLHGQGYVSPDPTPDAWKWRWDHRVWPRWYFWWFRIQSLMGASAVREVSEMNRLEVVPRVVDEAYVREIGTAFGFGPGNVVEEEDDFFLMSRPTDDSPDPEDPSNPSHLLTVFKNSGLYSYYNTGKMWKLETDISGEPIIPAIYPEVDSEPAATQFLTDPSHVNLMPVDTGDIYIESDELVKENTDTSEVYQYEVIRNVSYTRAVEAMPGMPASAAGPGARLRVYLDENGTVIGTIGNWRQVQTAGMVNVISKEDAWDLFVQNGMDAAVAGLYIDYDDAQPDLNTAVLGYYEHQGTILQTELIPVWIFDVDFYKDGILVHEGNIYIPAQQ